MDKAEGLRALRIVKNLLRGTHFLNNTVGHVDHYVGYMTGKIHFVGDYDHGVVLILQTPDDPQNFAGKLRIQCAGGLVKAKNVGVQGQCPGDGNTLLLTAGELVLYWYFFESSSTGNSCKLYGAASFVTSALQTAGNLSIRYGVTD